MTGISRSELRWCYRRFLGRAPEAAAWEFWSGHANNFDELVAGVIGSPEFVEAALGRAHARARRLLTFRQIGRTAAPVVSSFLLGCAGYLCMMAYFQTDTVLAALGLH